MHQTIEVHENLPAAQSNADGPQEMPLPHENDFISEFKKKLKVIRSAWSFKQDWSPPGTDIEAQIHPSTEEEETMAKQISRYNN